MSFGYSVGDFVAVGTLVLHLCRAYKGAPAEFDEIKRELSSFYIVTQDLQDQASQENSLLNRRGASRKEELDSLCENLMGTLGELQALHQKYGSMGGNFWKKVRLGDKDLTALRTKLTTHIGLINGFMTSLTMAAVGRMEVMMQKVLKVLLKTSRERDGVQSLVNAQEPSGGGWERLELELRSEGVPIDYIRERADDIRTLLDEVVADQDLSVLDDGIRASESASQAGRVEHPPPRRQKGSRIRSSKHSRAGSMVKMDRKAMLRNASTAEIEEATTLLWDVGYSMKNLQAPPKPPRLLSSIYQTSGEKARDKKMIEYTTGALSFAAASGNRLSVLLMLYGRDINSQFTQRGKTSVVVRAASSDCTDNDTLSMIQLLVECGAFRAFGTNTNWGGNDALVEAAKRGKEAVVRFLLTQGILVDDPDFFWSYKEGQNEWAKTALHAAVEAGHADVVRLLLEKGARVNREWKGETPLNICHSLRGAKRTETERILVEAGGKLAKVTESTS